MNTNRVPLTKAISLPLSAVSGEFFVLDGEEDPIPINMFLGFGDRVFFRISGGPDGSRIVIGDAPPQGVDMGEAGTTVVRDMSAEPVIEPVIGSAVIGITLVIGLGSGDLVGFGLRFSSGGPLWIINWDDGFVIDRVFPVQMEEDELGAGPTPLASRFATPSGLGWLERSDSVSTGGVSGKGTALLGPTPGGSDRYRWGDFAQTLGGAERARKAVNGAERGKTPRGSPLGQGRPRLVPLSTRVLVARITVVGSEGIPR